MSTLRVEALEQPDGTAFVFNNKNLLINGGMNVWQRSTSQASISNLGNGRYKTADRWDFYSDSIGTWTMAQSTDVPSAQGFGYSLKLDCTTANASPLSFRTLRIQQKIEAQNLQHLLFGTSSPKSITLSFWVKSNKTGTYIINLYREDVSARIISKSYTIDTADTWEKKTITFEGDETNAIANDNGSGIELRFFLAAGSLYTSGTLATSWESITNANIAVGQVNLADSTSNEWYITGCQLEVGSTASGFEFEPYEATYDKCLRYCWNWTLPQNTTLGLGYWYNSDNFTGIKQMFPRVMRAAPTVSTNSGTNYFKIEHGASSTKNLTDLTPRGATPENCQLFANSADGASGGSAGRADELLSDNNSAYFRADAEL